MHTPKTSPHFLQSAADPSSLITAPAPEKLISLDQWITDNQRNNTTKIKKKHRQQISKVNGEYTFIGEKGNYTDLDFETLNAEVGRLLLKTKAPAHLSKNDRDNAAILFIRFLYDGEYSKPTHAFRNSRFNRLGRCKMICPYVSPSP